MDNLVPIENIVLKIIKIRDVNIMLDRDLAAMYGVETRTLKQAVSRNIDRFPEDFMFTLTDSEVDYLISQYKIPNKGHLGGSIPMAFTDLGVAMLSSVLKSKTAVKVNIEIMRTFKRLSKKANENQNLAEEVNNIKKRVNSHDNQIGIIIDTLGQMALEEKEKEKKGKKSIGFKLDDEIKPVDPDKPLFPDKK